MLFEDKRPLQLQDQEYRLGSLVVMTLINLVLVMKTLLNLHTKLVCQWEETYLKKKPIKRQVF